MTFAESERCRGAGTLPEKSVVVTFDDAFLSVFDLAFPILSRLGLPATLFVPTRKVGTDGPMVWRKMERWLGGADEGELVGMSWKEVKELDRAGWEIGSHTRAHPYLTQLDDDALIDPFRQQFGGQRFGAGG